MALSAFICVGLRLNSNGFVVQSIPGFQSKKPRSPDSEETGFYGFVSIYRPHFTGKNRCFVTFTATTGFIP